MTAKYPTNQPDDRRFICDGCGEEFDQGDMEQIAGHDYCPDCLEYYLETAVEVAAEED